MADYSEFEERTKRLSPLWGQLRPGNTPCPFVVDDGATKHVQLSHCSAGHDAIYVQVSKKWGERALEKLSVTIRHASFVEGTTIIYDLIDETMQGKARPFDCDLSNGFSRQYMLLPCQIERILIAVRNYGDNRIVDVAFLDARNEIIQAALPFELAALDSSGKALESYFATTNRNGKTHRKLPAMCSRISVRSLLTGSTESATL